ncbi:hypothetical protein [Bailinhaonella thermotolerans]|uniref:Uncharacterized protein n=1 Tax=Bailinhaonella thermotolerans TaxID=1070861 RepID=A0A3A4BLS7_9ACTN|nr:hypothetical protein [Bailinhaonella thermotolerans]RJL31972.1 hypothetical protein D5H75_16130 [Bailinhaonella thermotolerans]
MDIVRAWWRMAALPAVVLADALLMLAAGWIVARTPPRGEPCEGASVRCAGADPTPAGWIAEMDFRVAVTFWSFGSVALIMLASALWGWRHRFRALAVVQLLALAVPVYVVALGVLSSYPSLR